MNWYLPQYHVCAQLPNPRRVESSLEVIVFGGWEENGEGKGGKPLESENIFFKGNEKYLEKENIVFGSEEKSQERKGGNYLEKENLFFCGGEKTDMERRKNLEKKNVFWGLYRDAVESAFCEVFLVFFYLKF